MTRPHGFPLPELGMRWRGSLGWVAAAMVCWAARLEGANPVRTFLCVDGEGKATCS